MSKASKYPESLVVAATMLSARGLKQKDIAETLDLHPSKVSRVLDDADQRGIRNPSPTLCVRNTSPEAIEGAERLLFARELAPRLGQLCPDGHMSRVAVVEDVLVNSFSHFAAFSVLPYIMDAQNLGVAWGLSVSLVVHGLDRLASGPFRGEGDVLRIVPVTGDPICVTRIVHQFSASALAAKIDAIVNDRNARGRVPSLSAVPAYLPFDLARSRNGIHRLLQRSAGYAEAIGDRKGSGLFQNIDVLLTGIGVPSTDAEVEPGVFVRERGLCEDIDNARLADLVLGDIAGVLIPRADLDKKDAAFVERLNKGWTGLRLEDIERCALRAGEAGRGGVIVVAQGAAKCDFVRALLRRGLVNHLVIDGALADALGGDRPPAGMRPKPRDRHMAVAHA